MARTESRVSLLCVVALLGCATADTHGSDLLALTHVTVIDVTTGTAQPDMTVVIRGERLADIGSANEMNPPTGARVVDASGKFLIPGLCDLHVHFAAEDTNLRLFVANGVTLVRGMGSVVIERGGDKGFTYVDLQTMIDRILDARDRVARGELLGPTIVTPGVILTGPLPPELELPYDSVDYQWALTTEAEARDAVRSLHAQGVDFIKVHTLTPREVYHAVADEAAKLGLTFAGHVPLSITAVEAVEAGQASIEHMTGTNEYLDLAEPPDDPVARERRREELFALYARSPATWHVPTMTVEQAFTRALDLHAHPERDPHLQYIRPELKAWWLEYWPPADYAAMQVKGEEALQAKLAWVAELTGAGVELLAGTDVAVPYILPGFSLHDELALFQQAGLTPAQALRTATLSPARFLGQDNDRGTVEVGKIADLVLLDANPLDDITNTTSIAGVVLRGRYFPQSELQAILVGVAESVR